MRSFLTGVNKHSEKNNQIILKPWQDIDCQGFLINKTGNINGII